MRNKWLRVIGLFLLGLLLIGIGVFFAEAAHVVLRGLDISLVNKVVSLETLPFYASGGICVLISVLMGIFAQSE